MEKLRLVGKLEEHTFKKEEELKPAELEYLFVCMYDDVNLISMNNHAVGFCEGHMDFSRRTLAKFKEVALIDPDFIATVSPGVVLVFEDMEMIIVENPKSELDEEELEDAGY